MASRKYIVSSSRDEDHNLPKFLWFGKKYKVYPHHLIQRDTWSSHLGSGVGEGTVAGPPSFRNIVRKVIISHRLSRSIDAKHKGATLQQCNLSPENETKVSFLLELIYSFHLDNLGCQSNELEFEI